MRDGDDGAAPPEAQSLLGRFLFSGWDAHEKQVSVLSGGERRRLALACVVASGANFLVLDEPTNHLDLESREALEAALEAFPGTVLLVSHDRALLDAVSRRLLAIEDGALGSVDGGWADYVRSKERREAPPEPPGAEAGAAGKPKPATEAGPTTRSSCSRRRSPATETRVADLEAQTRRRLERTSTRSAAHRAARDGLQALLERWEQLFEQAGA